MLQRVLSKRDLAGALKAGGGGGRDEAAAASKNSSSAFSREELRELFSLDVRTICGTREIMLKKNRVNYGKRRGGTGNEDKEEEGEEDAATRKWRVSAAACLPGDAEAGAPEFSDGDGRHLPDGRTQILAAVLSTGCVSWVHEEDGKASATEEEGDEEGGEEGKAAEEEVKVEEEGEEAIPAAAALDPLLDAAAAPAAGWTSIDDESHLEVVE
jgi:hypothetical protein